MRAQKPTRGSRRSPEASRAAILSAATLEFATEGLAGARTDAIARAAGVNKALLYYYFHDKEGLYGAVLQHALGDLLQHIMQILESDRSASYRILAYAATHFNFVASHPEYRRLMQFEMMRAGTGNSPHFANLIEVFFRPLMTKVIAVLQEGIGSYEFRPVHPQHFLQSMISVIVFYFVALPSIRAMSPTDPLSPAALRGRRDAVLDFVSGALFQDRESAARIISKVNRDVGPAAPHTAIEKSKRGKRQ
jgi:TetR/AcrR family transcriptional regulator